MMRVRGYLLIAGPREISSDTEERLDRLLAVTAFQAADELGSPVVCLLECVKICLERSYFKGECVLGTQELLVLCLDDDIFPSKGFV